jgi:hypothetical protein
MTVRARSLNTAAILVVRRLLVFFEVDFHGMARGAKFRAVGIVKKRRQPTEGNSADEKNDKANAHRPGGWAFGHDIPHGYN